VEAECTVRHGRWDACFIATVLLQIEVAWRLQAAVHLSSSTARRMHCATNSSASASFAAGRGASLKDLMARMGHDSERAAIIY
jgi:hypothetical protein